MSSTGVAGERSTAARREWVIGWGLNLMHSDLLRWTYCIDFGMQVKLSDLMVELSL